MTLVIPAFIQVTLNMVMFGMDCDAQSAAKMIIGTLEDAKASSMNLASAANARPATLPRPAPVCGRDRGAQREDPRSGADLRRARSRREPPFFLTRPTGSPDSLHTYPWDRSGSYRSAQTVNATAAPHIFSICIIIPPSRPTIACAGNSRRYNIERRSNYNLYFRERQADVRH